MKKNNVALQVLIFSLIVSALVGTTSFLVYGEGDTVQQYNKKKRKTKKNVPKDKKQQPVVSNRPIDEPIEDMETFVSTFDHNAKKKSVEALLQRGIDYCKDHTLNQVCQSFTHTKDFIEGALYLFLLDQQGMVYAHGDQSALLWKNLWNKHDMFGAPIIQSMIKLASTGGGWLTYEWDGAVKQSLVKQVTIDEKSYVIGCGFFSHSKEVAVIGLVKGAVALFDRYMAEKHKVEEAFSDMSYPLSPQFVFGDLYLYALDFKGTIFAQGDRPGLIGSNALDYVDASGKAYNKDIIALLKDKEKGEGVWVDYISKHASKHAYAEKVVDLKGNSYFIACGYYPTIDRNATVDLVRRGYQLMKSSGLSIAIKEFCDEQEEKYRFGDLGLFIYDMKGVCLAHGRHKDFIGQNQFNSQDADGRFFVQEFINQAKAGGGWINFKLNNSFQSTYVEKVDMGVGEFIIGAGMFPVSKPETMQLLVKSALAYLNGHTMDQLLGRIVDRTDEFLRGDLYLYVLDMSGFCYAWGDNYKLIWQNLLQWKDNNQKLFIKSMIDSSEQGPDHLVFKMNKCQRVNYFEQIEKDGKKYLIGSGFYK